MDELLEISGPEELRCQVLSAHVQPLAADVRRKHAPATHYAVRREGGLAGRCSIWAEGTPAINGEPVGVVGHYAAVDAEAGTRLLRHATQQLRERGLSLAVGPMDGNTWRRYRLVTRRGDEPPFFLEPVNPDDWPDHFMAAGFQPLARYFSRLNNDLAVVDPRVPAALARLADDGVVTRPIDMNNFDAELRRVHALSLAAFADNFLYTPVSEQDFLDMYQPMRAHVRPELVLLAEKYGTLIGFMLGLPDLAQARRGGPIDTVIAKSIAVRPGRTGAGLGSVLIDQFQQAARGLGYRRVVHALMHEGNRSRQMVARFGHPMREYTLFARTTDG
ncbi:MAG: GNAT family N-acetyltransferase [Actinomycetota bacterium]|nr:GNAT family N-acetyltransferase [Actinomycetota bacterium]